MALGRRKPMNPARIRSTTNGVTGVRDTGAWISLSEIRRWQEHLDGPVLECAFANTPNLREQMVAGKVPPTLEILQSALDHCDPGKMTNLFKLLAKNETWQVPTLVQLLFTEKPDAARDPRLKY